MTEILQIIKEFKRKLSELGEAEIILFGSYARSDAEKESDIDIFVILDREIDIKVKEAVYDLAYEFSLEYNVVLDVNVYSREEWDRYKGIHPLILNAENEGIVV